MEVHTLSSKPRIYILILLAACLPILLTASPAQEKFVPIPPGLAKKYRFDYPRNFFPSPAAEKADRKKANALLASLEKYKGKVTASASNLYNALELSDRAQSEVARHAIYLY